MKNKWKDVQVFNHGYAAYLLQAKRSWTGRVRFRIAKCGGIGSYSGSVTVEEIQRACPEKTIKS